METGPPKSGIPAASRLPDQFSLHQEVTDNAESYLRQFFKVVDQDRTQVVWQSEWFGKFTLTDVIRLTSRFTVAQFLERDDFAQRFSEHRPIAITELLYPLLQAYDSVAIESDVEFGGTDQKFNLLVGRELQGMMGQKPQQCFLMPMLVGTDGVQKMSKSLGNYVAVEEPPNDMYGKVMSLPDELIYPYFEYPKRHFRRGAGQHGPGTGLRHGQSHGAEKRLAREITTQFHDRRAADAAEANFEQVVQRRDLPDDIPDFVEPSLAQHYDDQRRRISNIIAEAGLASSTTEAKRLINQGAIEVINESTGETRRLMRDGRAATLGLRHRSVLKEATAASCAWWLANRGAR